MDWARSLVVGGAVGGAALTTWLGLVVVQHSGRDVYDLPRLAVVAGLVGAVAAVGGWLLVAGTGDPVVFGAAAVAVLFVGGIAALLSIGVLLILAATGATVALLRAAGHRREAGRAVPARAAIGAALLVGLGLPVLALVSADGPRVTCLRGGVATESSIFRSSGGGSSGSGSSSTAGVGTVGTTTSGGRTYRYRCVGDELVEFEIVE